LWEGVARIMGSSPNPDVVGGLLEDSANTIAQVLNDRWERTVADLSGTLAVLRTGPRPMGQSNQHPTLLASYTQLIAYSVVGGRHLLGLSDLELGCIPLLGTESS
jgi:hypothetical protein